MEYRRWKEQNLRHRLDREVMVNETQKAQLSANYCVYLSMDSPHGNYPLRKASSVGVNYSFLKRKWKNDSGYSL